MAFEWIDNLLGNKISKEAAEAQGKNAQDHFDKKVKAHAWVNEVLDLDPTQVEKEYQANLAAEAKMLGKTAAYEMGETTEETVKKDYERDVKILSDYALAEMLAEYRGQKEQNTAEMFHEHKEKAKKEVASSREKAEKALLDLVGTHTALDWQKAFERFSKDAKVETPTEKDLYEPKAPEAAHDFSKPTEEKFKVPAEDKKADVMIGVGREADERTDVTVEAGVVQEDITKGLGKTASTEKKSNEVIKEAHCGSCPGDPGVKEADYPIKREQLYPTAELCPVCGGEGKDLANGQADHMSCMACGISYGPQMKQSMKCQKHKCDMPDDICDECLKEEDARGIQSHASKADTIKKIAEIESPWKVIKDESGQEVIARVLPETTNTKESEEKKEEEIQK